MSFSEGDGVGFVNMSKNNDKHVRHLKKFLISCNFAVNFNEHRRGTDVFLYVEENGIIAASFQ